MHLTELFIEKIVRVALTILLILLVLLVWASPIR